jgi:hypothetical protein
LAEAMEESVSDDKEAMEESVTQTKKSEISNEEKKKESPLEEGSQIRKKRLEVIKKRSISKIDEIKKKRVEKYEKRKDAHILLQDYDNEMEELKSKKRKKELNSTVSKAGRKIRVKADALYTYNNDPKNDEENSYC